MEVKQTRLQMGGARSKRALVALCVPLVTLTLLLVSPPTRAQAPPVIRTIPLPATALAWDAARQKLYATIGSKAPLDRANTLTTIDPAAGKIEKSVFMGSSEPDRPVVSAGGQYVYVRVGGLFRRYDVDAALAGPYVTWPGGGYLKQVYPHPTDPESLLLLLGGREGFAGSETAVLSGGKMRPSRVKYGGELLVPTIAPSFVYMATRAALHIGDSGVKICWGTENDGALGNSAAIPLAGLLVNTSGFVYDQETQELQGHLPRNVPDMTLAADPSRATVIRLSDEKLSIYDVRTFSRIREIPVPGYREGRNLTRWGKNGVAFTTANEVVLVSADLGPLLPPVDLDVFRSDIQAKRAPGSSGSYRLTIQNRSKSPSSAAFLTDKLPDGVEISGVRASQGKATASGRLIRASLGSIPPGKIVTLDVTFVRTAREDDAEPDGLRFYAVVRGYEPDPNGDNNVSAVQVNPP